LSQTIDKKPESIGLYIHFERTGCFIAGGLHMPNPQPLKLLRDRLLEDWGELDKILNNRIFKKEFPVILSDETLTNVPRGYPKNHPSEKYLKLKGFTVYCDMVENDFFNEKLIDLTIKKGKAMEPFARFLLESVEG
jgi:uncharacterized protein (DUF2461 family)